MSKQEEQKIYIMSEVTVPGAEYGLGAAQEVCTKCGKLKKECECKK